MKIRQSFCFILLLALLLLNGNFTVWADAPQPATDQQKTVLVDARDVPFEEMTLEEQEAYKERVKSEVVAAVSILAVFLLFVFIISAFRFTRNYRNILKVDKKKKFDYVDLWGNPRVQLDDMPTDEEMQGEEEFQ